MPKQYISDKITDEYSTKVILEFTEPICINRKMLLFLQKVGKQIIKMGEKENGFRITFKHMKRNTNSGWEDVKFGDMYKEDS